MGLLWRYLSTLHLSSISNMSKRLFIISGEPSGDLHGANLVKELKAQDPNIDIACWGGDKMKSQGATVLKHIDELAFMGFVEVLANIFTIIKNFRLCQIHIKSFNPDALVLIDYPGFNLRMAEHIYKLGIPVHYYISPQIWAWKESRAKKIKAFVKRVFVILPFEQEFYNKHGINAEYVGHPLLDEIQQFDFDKSAFCVKHQLDANKPIIAVLPGSRKQEISKILPLINGLPSAFVDYQIVVSKVSWLREELYHSLLNQGVAIVDGDTYKLIKNAEAAVITSGTATLETAIIGTPEVVVYKANALSVWLARILVKVKYISLVNLILDRMSITELIQSDANTTALITELRSILLGGDKREQILNDYVELNAKLGAGGASKIVASQLLKSLNQ